MIGSRSIGSGWLTTRSNMPKDFPIIATGDAVIFKEKAVEDAVTTSGIIMPGDAINKNDHHGIFGTVLSVGANVKNYKPGDVILVNKFDSVPFPHQTEVLHFTTANLVRAKVRT